MYSPKGLPAKRSRLKHTLIVGLIVIGLGLIVFFGLKAVRSYIRIKQTSLRPGVTEVEAVRGWMTVPYIAKAYRVPEAYLFKEIGIPQEGNRKRSLADLNREYAPGERTAIVNRVKKAIKNYQTLPRSLSQEDKDD